MLDAATTFAGRYAAAFRDYLEDGTERSLEAAYELGRGAVAEGLTLMHVAEAHHAAVRDATDETGAELADAAATFFRESLATFEIAHRGYQEAQEAARLEQAHAAQQRALAEAALAINATLSPQRILEEMTRRALDIVHARGAVGEIRLARDQDPLVALAGDTDVRGDTALRTALAGREERELGSLTIHGAELGGREEKAESILLQLAQMGSMAIENAQRYQRERQIAETLQRSLLPPGLPDIPGMDAAARFWPAGDGIHVGGDFYDLFRTPWGDWAAVIGDVCGKGPAAASLTALARYTVRAAGLHEHRPSKVLGLLNAAMLEHRTDGRFATVLCAYLTPMPGRVRILAASGGHPLPLVCRGDGQVETIGGGGTLLGVVAEPALSDAEADLHPGDTVVFYTDGVIEVRRDRKELFGAEDLAGLLRSCAGLPPGEILTRVEQEVLERSGGKPRDDIALVALQVRP